jgi:hypothetical protein
MNEHCRKAGFWDHIAVIGLFVAEKITEDKLKAETEKPSNQRNNVGIIIGEFFKLGCGCAKYKANENLCNPIG